MKKVNNCDAVALSSDHGKTKFMKQMNGFRKVFDAFLASGNLSHTQIVVEKLLSMKRQLPLLRADRGGVRHQGGGVTWTRKR